MKNTNLQRATEFAVGLLFGWGLMIAGMTDPGKVIGFLDLAGAWDPSLAFVMAKKRTTNFFGGALHLPTSKDIDKRLVIGSLLFGAGWGLAGFCPGPGIVSMAAGEFKGLVFVAAMVAGMAVFEFTDRRAAPPQPKAA
jgi:uncharacterized membrane protein YedE/YeeE